MEDNRSNPRPIIGYHPRPTESGNRMPIYGEAEKFPPGAPNYGRTPAETSADHFGPFLPKKLRDRLDKLAEQERQYREREDQEQLKSRPAPMTQAEKDAERAELLHRARQGKGIYSMDEAFDRCYPEDGPDAQEYVGSLYDIFKMGWDAAHGIFPQSENNG